MLSDNGAMFEIISQFHGNIPAETGETIETDQSHVTTASVLYDAIFIPGGKKSIESMMLQGDVIHFINEAYKHAKPIGATGEALALFRKSSIVGAKIASANDNDVISHQGVVTVNNMKDLEKYVR